MRHKWVVSLTVFVLFLSYFSFTAYHLPNQAGPDFQLSRLASDFYYDHKRMATVAGDEDKMFFSAYGNTRLLRPPLGFYLPAQMAKLPVLKKLDRYYAYRLANALLGAMTVLMCFLALRLYFNNDRYAIYGALCVGLMPQFTFYASYLNDDMAALFAASFFAYAMVKIRKYGSTLSTQLVFAAAAGLTVITKETAWIFFGAAILFYVFYILRFNKDFFVQHMLMGTMFVIAGGWWLLFNMYHYGWSEAMLSKTVEMLTDKYARYDLSEYGFSAKHGVEMRHLLVLNFMNFIGASYQAFIGHLDWLRLRVGSMQYGFYLWMVVAMALNLVVLTIDTYKFLLEKMIKKTVSAESIKTDEIKSIGFQWIMYAAIIIQVLLYTWHNVNKDIQIQGKYLMPVMVPILILSFAFIERFLQFFQEKSSHFYSPPKKFRYLGVLILFALPIIVHLDALVDYVIPFYWPNVQIPAILNWL